MVRTVLWADSKTGTAIVLETLDPPVGVQPAAGPPETAAPVDPQPAPVETPEPAAAPATEPEPEPATEPADAADSASPAPPGGPTGDSAPAASAGWDPAPATTAPGVSKGEPPRLARPSWAAPAPEGTPARPLWADTATESRAA
jgi:hypothetical protein